MTRARRSTLARLQYLAASTAVATACTGYEVVDPVPPPATCSGDDAGVADAFTAHAVWIRPNDATTVLVLVITVTKSDAAFSGQLTFDLASNAELSNVVSDASGNLVLTMKPFVSGSQVDLNFTLVCNDQHRGSGRASASWSSPPVEGRTEVVTLSSP